MLYVVLWTVVFGQEADFHKFSQRFTLSTWPKVVVWPAMSRLLLLLLLLLPSLTRTTHAWAIKSNEATIASSINGTI
jgi:hypothetical protein